MSNSDTETALCPVFETGRCRSCALLSVRQGQRSERKFRRFQELSGQFGERNCVIEAPLSPSVVFPSRSKVKAAVTGTTEKPVIGFVDKDLQAFELRDCPLVRPELNDLLGTFTEIVPRFGLVPYDIAGRRGELKYVLATIASRGDEGIVRMVLRSRDSLEAARRAVATIQERHPWATVITVNLQPAPAAILEGPEEIFLTDARYLTEHYGKTAVVFGPRSFMQVTHETACALYDRAAQAIAEIKPSSLLDLFCGAGGFCLAGAPHVQSAIGLEVSEDAVSCAQKGAALNGYNHCDFRVCDIDVNPATVHGFNADAIIVNPPRRGLQKDLIDRIVSGETASLLYSSCNPETLFRDLEALKPSFRVDSLSPFDMFPLTDHLEVLAVLRRRTA